MKNRRLEETRLRVGFNEEGLFVDGKNVPLVGGEFHYWRTNPLYWGKILDGMKDAGLELVSTYICWDFHEVEKGVFDFDGRTNQCRDLSGFLDLCKEKSMPLMVRPGPFIYAEWPTNGPARDVFMKERLDPEFLKRSREWIRAVCRVLVPRQATRGGPIVMLQVDNEIAFPLSTGDDMTQAGGEGGYDRQFVRKAYGDWMEEKLGKRLEVDVPDFRRDGLAKNLRAIEFSKDKVKEFLKVCRQMYLEEGIEVPTYANIGQFLTFQDWTGEEKIVDSVGIDNYMPSMLKGDQSLVVSWYYRLARARTRFPWSPEFQAGIWVGMDKEFGIINGEHIEYMGLLALTLGLRGLSYYMFVDRDNWHYSPLNERGEKRPSFASYQKVIQIAKSLGKGTHLADVGLVWHPSHNRAFVSRRYADLKDMVRYWMDFDGPKEEERWWRTFRTLHRLDVDFDILDPTVSNLKKKVLILLSAEFLGLVQVLIYAGDDFLDPESMGKMARFVREGGKLIVASNLPVKDSSLRHSDEMVRLKRQMEASGRVQIVEPEGLKGALKATDFTHYIQTDHEGVWSFVYRDEGALVVFMVNTMDEE
ncbi:MAG: beta-galactosidase, partial [Thermodesulfobacteriota bacterium]